MASKKHSKGPRMTKAERRAAAKARAAARRNNQPPPAFTDGYLPTLQADGKYRDVRGNPPEGITDVVWKNMYNNADTVLFTDAWTPEERLAGRLSGFTRKVAIDFLKQDGLLPNNYVDWNW